MSIRVFVAAGFEPVREAFQSLFDRGWDSVSAFSAYVDGRPVVQLTGGWGGAGGQMARFSPDHGLGCAYVTDTLGALFASHDPRGNLLLATTLRCLGAAR